jgi:hypothetical protein
VALIDDFRRAQWDAEPRVIGRHDVLYYEMLTPSAQAKCLVWPGASDHLFHTSAWNSYNEKLAELILDRCSVRSDELPKEKLIVLPGDFGAVSQFEAVVVAPPSVRLFDHLPEPISSKIYLVAPAFRSEFTSQMSAKDFRHQIGRKDGWRVYVYRWDRTEKTQPSWD